MVWALPGSFWPLGLSYCRFVHCMGDLWPQSTLPSFGVLHVLLLLIPVEKVNEKIPVICSGPTEEVAARSMEGDALLQQDVAA